MPAPARFRVRTGRGSFDHEAPADDRPERGLFWVGLADDEPETIGEFERLVSAMPGIVVLDVGANRGIFSLVALAASPTCTVVAVEPTEGTADHLESVVALNGWAERLRLVRAAAADHEGTMSFEVPRNPFPCHASLVGVGKAPVAGSAVVEVPVTTLDALVEGADIVKIDVEGAEHLVLAGMHRLLATSRPSIIMEVLPESQLAKCASILRQHNYEFFHLTKAGPVQRDRLEPDQSRNDRNYLCRPRS